MIITSIRIMNEFSDLEDPLDYVDLVIGSATGDNGYVLKGLDGFDPSATTPFTEGFDANGIPFIDNIPINKELVLKIGFNPGPMGTYSSLRDKLYKMYSQSVDVYLMSESTAVCHITGFIRIFDVAHATNQPDVQLTIRCNDGLFIAPEKYMIFNYGDPTPPSLSTPVITAPLGTAPGGFYMKLQITAATPDMWGLTGAIGPYTWEWQVLYNFAVGDILEISTHRLDRSVFVDRGGILTEITQNMTTGGIWPKLKPGDNSFITMNPFFDWWEISYFPRYWGL